MTIRAAKPGFPWLLIGLSIPALAVLLSLGTWQVQRLAWKEDLLATIDARLADAPVSLDVVLERQADGQDIEYTPVQVSGVFDHAGEQHFFATHQGRSGYYLYTPLERADGSAVFVNRGFVPFELKEAAMRPASLVGGNQEIEGLARQILSEKPSWVVPDNDPAGNTYYWKDIQAMTQMAELDGSRVQPFFVDAGFPDADYPRDALPVPGVTLIDLPNNHLQYAVTWYGLAATLVIVVGLMLRRRNRA